MTSSPHRPWWTTAAAVLLAILCGVGMAAQARINGELSVRIDNGVLAALISFGIGMVIVAVAMLVSPASRRGLGEVLTQVRERRIPWVYLIGGMGGAFLVLSQGLVAASLGVALFSIGVVAGQTLSGLVIDRRGVGTMGPRPITAPRVIGALLALAAVVYAGWSQLDGSTAVWLIVLPFLAGIGIAWQQAFNGQVREVSGSAITATFVNFVAGTTVLIIATLVASIWRGWPSELPTDPVVYLGGVIGVIFIAGGAIAVRYLGVLLLGLGMISGQLIGSLVLDLVVPAEGHELGIPTVVSTIVTLLAVSLTILGGRRRRA
ncbi:MAG: DMT family transporter [Rhodoglobus sp.]|nr:DMT family transporter [Rhodoglobus sp.]